MATASTQNIVGVSVSGNLCARDINVLIAPQPPESPPKNIRFKVEKPIQTFTGREAFLEDLHKVVKGDQDPGQGGGITVLTQAPLSVVAATGGIGKTETVRMYIKLHEHEYDHVVWIDAENTSFAKTQFAQLAIYLKISTDFDGRPKEFELILKEIFEKLLQNAHMVLLVLDNAEAYEDDLECNLSGIRDFIPKSLSPFFVEPTIIVTSRNQNWVLQTVIHLELWTEAEVVLFVTRRLGLEEKNSENYNLATQLGTLFGHLPIAIQSAVAVILQQTKRNRGKKYGIQNLLDEYENGSRKVLKQKPLDANMRPALSSFTMLVLWNISLEKIVKFTDGELAIQILCFIAYMSPTRIPQDFLYALFENSSSLDSFENALEILEDYTLITKSYNDSPTNSLSIHRMIQDATIENLRTNNSNKTQTKHPIFSEKTFLNETEVLLKLSNESLNYLKTLEIEAVSSAGEILEILVQITNFVSQKLHIKEFRKVTEDVAMVLLSTHNATKAIEFYERALKATPSSDVYSEYINKMELKRKLAAAYSLGGYNQKSVGLCFEVLEEETRVLGPHHEWTLRTKWKLANALEDIGKCDEAGAKYREVLQDYHDIQYTQNDAFLMTTNDYAFHLLTQGETKKAFKVLIEVLEEYKRDPYWNLKAFLITKSHMARLLEIDGKLEEASEMILQSIADATKEYGSSHPNVLNYKLKYAKLLQLQDKNNLASLIMLESLEIAKSELGTSHPSTFNIKIKLADLYSDTKEFEKALSLLDVEACEKVLGQKHPKTMDTALRLAYVMEDQGKFKDALALHQKVCKIRQQVVGLNHPDTLSTMHSIGQLYSKMDEFDLAALMAEEVWLRRGEVLGKDHPRTIRFLELLTNCREFLSILAAEDT